MNAQLREWAAKFDVVKAQGAKAAAEVKIDYHKQIENWAEKETVFKQKLDELASAGADRFEALKAGTENMWTELKSKIESFGVQK